MAAIHNLMLVDPGLPPAPPPPGTSWIGTYTTGTALFGVAASANIFVAVGTSGTIVTSPDGITWTTRTSGTTNDLWGCVYTGTQFVAVGKLSTVLTSPDGITWTTRTLPSPLLNLIGVAWGNGQIIVVGESGACRTSPDGITWTIRSPGFTLGYSAARNSSLTVVVGGNASYQTAIRTSPDLVTWTTRSAPTTSMLYSIIWTGTLFIATGGSGACITSPDGITWTFRGSGTLAGNIWATTFDGTQYIAVGPQTYAFRSTDTINWTRHDFTNPNTMSFYGVAKKNSSWVATGGFSSNNKRGILITN